MITRAIKFFICPDLTYIQWGQKLKTLTLEKCSKLAGAKLSHTSRHLGGKGWFNNPLSLLLPRVHAIGIIMGINGSGRKKQLETEFCPNENWVFLYSHSCPKSFETVRAKI